MIPSQLIREMPEEFFGRVLAACPRRSRETLFARFSIPKAKKTASSLLPGKDPARVLKLQRAFAGVGDEDGNGQQLAEELIRVYLMGKRSLLGAALDELGIDHQDGLTDAELDGISELDADAAQALASTLSQTYDPLDVMLYLRFMGAELSGFEV